MNALISLSGQALLVLSVVCARPAATGCVRLRVLSHAAALGVCLFADLLAHPAGSIPLLAGLCLLALLLEFGAVFVLARPRSEQHGSPPLWPMGVAVLAVWLAFRLLPGATASPGVVALGIVLCALVTMLAARDDAERWASLLFAGHGVLLFVGTVPGIGWSGLLVALPWQILVLSRVCARPVWSDRTGPEPER